MTIFFRIGTIAVAIFEIDPKIFDRLAFQFLLDPGVNRVREPGRRIVYAHTIRVSFKPMSQTGRVIQHVGKLVASRQAQRARENHKVGRVFN